MKEYPTDGELAPNFGEQGRQMSQTKDDLKRTMITLMDSLVKTDQDRSANFRSFNKNDDRILVYRIPERTTLRLEGEVDDGEIYDYLILNRAGYFILRFITKGANQYAQLNKFNENLNKEREIIGEDFMQIVNTLTPDGVYPEIKYTKKAALLLKRQVFATVKKDRNPDSYLYYGNILSINQDPEAKRRWLGKIFNINQGQIDGDVDSINQTQEMLDTYDKPKRLEDLDTDL